MNPMVEIQQSVRQNSEELQDFLRDMSHWKEQMTKKDKELRDEIIAEGENVPPIRSSVPLQKKREKSRNKVSAAGNGSEKKTKCMRIASHDYASWEKYDVDAACEAVDQENEETESPDEVEEEEDFEELHQKDMALEEKEKGNEFFRMGKLDQAIECYTRGMLCDPSNAFLPANRSLALYKQERYASAEQDCSLAIALDRNYVKAYQRRGMARAAQKKYELAKEDFMNVLKLEPNNTQARTELVNLRKSLEAEKTTLLQSEDSQGSTEKKGMKVKIEEVCSDSKAEIIPEKGVVMPIRKPPHLQSKKPLRRIDVCEVGSRSEEKSSLKQVAPPSSSIESVPESERYEEPKKMQPLAIPTTSFQFQTDWRQLRHSKEQLYIYLKAIPPLSYPQLFQHSLEADMLSDLLHVYLHYYLRDGIDVMEDLVTLARVQRFKMLLMFLSENDKKVINDILEIVKTQKSAEEVALLSQLYGV